MSGTVPLAALRRLDAALRGARSATAALEAWCGRRGLPATERIAALSVPTAARPPGAARRRRLRLGPGVGTRYRRVRLVLSGIVLSEAENWYVPSRLLPGMNRALDGSAVPFGRAVAALGTRRRTLSVERLALSDRPDAWPVGPILRHRALLLRRDGMPFSEVVETYEAALLASLAGEAPEHPSAPPGS